MKIAIIGTQGVPGKYGGFETLAENLIDHLSSESQITIFCSRRSYANRERNYKNARRIFLPLKANGIQSIPYDIISMIISVFISDTILILGVSGCIILPIIKLFSNKKFIVNIDGLEWKRDKWSVVARLFLRLSEKVAVKSADKIISDNINIKDYIYREYGKQSDLIEYGGDHVKKIKPNKMDIIKYPFLKEKYTFALSRIEPENNCDIILHTFRNNPSYKFVYVGNWQTSSYGKKLSNIYKDYANILLIDPIYDLQELDVIRSNCHIYIHGHRAGGTNPSLVEAMYLGLPIIAFDVNFNRSTTHNKALYFNNNFELMANIRTLDSGKKARNIIIKNLKNIASIEYRWGAIIRKYRTLLS